MYIPNNNLQNPRKPYKYLIFRNILMYVFWVLELFCFGTSIFIKISLVGFRTAGATCGPHLAFFEKRSRRAEK